MLQIAGIFICLILNAGLCLRQQLLESYFLQFSLSSKTEKNQMQDSSTFIGLE